MNIDELNNSVCKRFKPEEMSRVMLREWDDLPLPHHYAKCTQVKKRLLNILVSRL